MLPLGYCVNKSSIRIFCVVLILFTICSAYGDETQYTYDEMNRLVRTEHIDAGSTTDYTYDALGNIVVYTESATGANQPPNTPSNVAPVDLTVNLSPLSLTLSWSAVDADQSDVLVYDLYLGKQSPAPLYFSGLTTPSFTVTNLDSVQGYYWKVVVRDNHNNVISSPEWQFTTGNNPPPAPAYVSPANNAYVSYNGLVLQWQAVTDPNPDDAILYDIYLTSQDGSSQVIKDQKATSYQVSGLDPWKPYTWKVIAKDNHGAFVDNTSMAIHPLDTDKDGFPDDVEDGMCIDKYKADTDGDGLLDGQEDVNHNGIVDPGETNPCDSDTDKDGMPDGWEVAHSLNPLVDDSMLDADGDGVPNIYEYLGNSNPNDPASTPSTSIIYENFDKGKFSVIDPINSGNAAWAITDTRANTGHYAIQSGKITDSQSTVMETIVKAVAGDMSFYVSTSSEACCDKLNFYIDDVLQGTWSGEQAYHKVSYPVTDGIHHLKWVYAKDGSVSSGSDAVWVDDIVVPGFVDEDNDGIIDSWEYHYFNDLNHDMSLDTDGDGLTDLQEGQLLLNPTSSDTDGDGMPDAWEVANNLEPLRNDANADADGDTVTNLFEYMFGTNPNNNQDTPVLITTGFESGTFDGGYWTQSGNLPWTVTGVRPATGVYSAQAGAITHNQKTAFETIANTRAANISFNVSTSSEACCDKLNFYIDDVLQGSWSGEQASHTVNFPMTAGVHHLKWEYAKDGSVSSGSDTAWVDDIVIPALRDEDSDGIVDGWEYYYFTDLNHDMTLDTDGDGLTDLQEGQLLLNPTSVDTDGDGMPDGWEVANQLDPLHNDADADADGDGVSNLYEYYLGTNPQDSLDVPALLAVNFETGTYDEGYWIHSGTAHWSVTGTRPASGVYSAQSGKITDNQKTAFETIVNTSAAQIRFNVSTSSEACCDKLNFYIDNVLQGSWSGELAYRQVTIPVMAGIHHLKWEYAKDGSVSAGSDAAWIDDIIIPGYVDEDQDGIVDGWEYRFFGDLNHDMSLDTDGDGLTDQQEGQLFLDPTKADTDGDLMPDGWEVSNYLDPFTNDATADADGDGVSNLYEYYMGTNPNDNLDVPPLISTDFETGTFNNEYFVHSGAVPWSVTNVRPASGMYSSQAGAITNNQKSAFETIAKTNAADISFNVSTSSEACCDKLNFYIDGVLQGSWSGEIAYRMVFFPVTAGIHRFKWEYAKDGSVSAGSDTAWVDDIIIPGLVDEDKDGIIDGWEYYYFNDLNHDMSLDSDGDGLTDLQEGQLLLDPFYTDTDADGMPDAWEVTYQLDPLHNDAAQDADGDGVSNWYEYYLGTNPRDAADVPQPQSQLIDFETGALNGTYWIQGGNAPWSVTNVRPASGVYSAQAGRITNSQSTSLQMVAITNAGNISFNASTSSEANYDFLRFYIDNVLQGSWSGELAYTPVSFPVTAGGHVFKWVYSKDGSGSVGADSAWVDDIQVP